MRKVLLLIIGILLCASAAFGQAGGIYLFVDNGYADCEFVDATSALVPIYVVHKMTPGATGSQWMLVPGGGWNCMYTGEIVHMPTSIGSTLSGISLGYGGCLPSDILLVTVNWFCQGVSPNCAYVEVVGDPASGSGTVEAVDCSFTLITYVAKGIVWVNTDASCQFGMKQCGVPYPVPARETNWGQVKALY